MTTLVTGATGTVGNHVVRALRERGAPVRAFTRDAEKAARVLGEDVELAVGDLADRASLDRALRGADRLFLACANVPGQVGLERAAIDAAAAAGVARVVKLSGPGVAPSLLFEAWHREIEDHLLGTGLPWTLLRPATYMTNLLAFAEAIARTGTLPAPAGAAEIAFVDPRDVGEAAAAALTTDGHAGRAYTLTGPEAITFTRIADELTAATGRPVAFVDVPDDAAREAMVGMGLPPVVAEFIVGMFGMQRAGAMARTTDAVRALTGREPRTLAAFAREHAALFGAPAPDVLVAGGRS